MTSQTVSSKVTTTVKRAALFLPVQITERGNVSPVLVSITHYDKLIDRSENILDLLTMPESDIIAFEPPKLNSVLVKVIEFD